MATLGPRVGIMDTKTNSKKEIAREADFRNDDLLRHKQNKDFC